MNNSKWYNIFRSISLVVVAGLLAVLVLGCPGERKAFSDSASPEWTYDKPFYLRPIGGPAAIDGFELPIPEIYTQKRQIQIPRPKTGDPRKGPRVAIWMTDDNGISWTKIGYFGLQQSFFTYSVDKDSVYGIRFIGPGIPPAKCKPPKPHMNFYVDTEPPAVSVFISPDQETYNPGQMITVEWVATDLNIKPDSIKINVCLNSKSAELNWFALGKTHPCISNADLLLPDEAIDKIISIRVIAEDLSGNLGYGYSCPVDVIYEPLTTRPASSGTESKSKTAKVILTSEGPQVLTTMPAKFPSLEK